MEREWGGGRFRGFRDIAVKSSKIICIGLGTTPHKALAIIKARLPCRAFGSGRQSDIFRYERLRCVKTPINALVGTALK